MDQNVILLLILAVSITILIILLLNYFKKDSQIKILYSYDISEDKGLFKDRTKVTFKAHLLLNKVPHGEPIILATHEFIESDRTKLEKLIQEQLIPLLKEATNLTEAINKLTSAKKLFTLK